MSAPANPSGQPPTVLELGSGSCPTFVTGARMIHLDRVESPHVELVCDLNHGIPLPSNVVDHIIAIDVVEHLREVLPIMDEMHRVLRPGGTALIQVPEAGGYYHHTDPTHVRGFTGQSFDFFDDDTFFGQGNGKHYTPRRWSIVRRERSRDGNLTFLMVARKPGERRRDWELVSSEPVTEPALASTGRS
jgi:SAM-dependent methyltransferase